MKDTGLKELLFQHHWAQRHFVQPEVEVFHDGGIADPTRAITDVDVFALRPHEGLFFERVLGDCRTLAKQSPINRALWLRGLMQFMGAREGCVLLKAERGIEPDHKLAASRMGVLLFSQEDFGVYDKATVYPGGSKGASVTVQDIRDLRSSNGNRTGKRSSGVPACCSCRLFSRGWDGVRRSARSRCV